MLKKLVIVLGTLVFSLALSYTSLAHPGKTDQYGGHYDRKTGVYHFHNDKTKNIPTYSKPFKTLILLSENEKFAFYLLNIVDIFINEEGSLCVVVDSLVEAKGYQDAAIYRNYFIIKPYKAPVNTIIHLTIFDKDHPLGFSEFPEEKWTEITNQNSGYTSFVKVLGYGAANGEFAKRSIVLNKFVNSSFAKDINYNKDLFVKTTPSNISIKEIKNADGNVKTTSQNNQSKPSSKPITTSSSSGYGVVYGFIGFLILAVFLLIKPRKNSATQIRPTSAQTNTNDMDIKILPNENIPTPLNCAKNNNIKTIGHSTASKISVPITPPKPPTFEKSFPYRHTYFNPVPNVQNKQKWLKRNHKRHYFWLKNIFGNEIYYLSEFFLNLKDSDWQKLLADYELNYGKNAKKYAEATYPLWRNKTVKFSYQTSNRFLTLIPPYLPPDYKYYLLQSVIMRNKSVWNNDATIEYEAALWLSIGNEDSANGSLGIIREQVKKGNVMYYHKQYRRF